MKEVVVVGGGGPPLFSLLSNRLMDDGAQAVNQDKASRFLTNPGMSEPEGLHLDQTSNTIIPQKAALRTRMNK